MMRLNNLSRFNYTSAGLGVTGGTLLGPVQLHADPIDPLEAVTVRYVENSILNHTSSVPHLSSSERNLLNGITVTSGEINSVQGLTNNLALQLNGRLRTTGGTITGALTLHADPTNRLHALTKRYVDSTIELQSSVNAGTIVSLPQDTPPVGYLRANGAAVSQSTFSSLFSVVGHRFAEEVSTASTFTTNAALGAGAPWEQQFGFNNATELGTFVSDGILPVNLAHSPAIVTSSRVFLLGGWNGAAIINTIFSAVIQADGTLGAFTAVGTLPVNLAHSSAIVTSSRVFLLGGWNGAAIINTIFGAVIQADGTLSAFTAVGTLPVNLARSSVVVTRNRVFLLGGSDVWPNTINTIFSAVIQADGTLGVFTSVGTLPVNLADSSVIVTSSRVFLLGGNTGAVVINTIHSAVIQADGTLGVFTSVGTLPVNLHASSTIVTSSRVFLLGGHNGAAAINTIFSAVIQADGTLGAFTAVGTLPANVHAASAFFTSSRVFLLAGHVNALNSSAIFSAPLIGGSGLNDYSRFYNGSINTFNGAPLSGAIVVFTRNPDRNTLFMLPNGIQKEQLLPGNFVYIKT